MMDTFPRMSSKGTSATIPSILNYNHSYGKGSTWYDENVAICHFLPQQQNEQQFYGWGICRIMTRACMIKQQT